MMVIEANVHSGRRALPRGFAYHHKAARELEAWCSVKQLFDARQELRCLSGEPRGQRWQHRGPHGGLLCRRLSVPLLVEDMLAREVQPLDLHGRNFGIGVSRSQAGGPK